MSCLFDSLSFFFKNIESKSLRNSICDYLESNPELIEDLPVDQIILGENPNIKTLKKYIEIMRLEQTWGGSIEIKCFCDIYGFNVNVIMNNGSIVHHYSNKNNVECVLYIKYTGSHFTPFAIEKI